jgi:hypothetical protein
MARILSTKQSGWTTFFNTLGVLFAIIATAALFLGITWETSQGLFESKTPRGPEKETIEINWYLIRFGFWAVAWSITMYLFSHVLQVLWDMRNYLRGMYEREPATTESADSAADVLPCAEQ